MSGKPIFTCTHPRACSTAFERVFMTRKDDLKCVHEPFGDAFYYGPERMSRRFEDDEKAREESGFANSTFKTIFDRIDREGSEGKRLFIKDIIHYLVPPKEQPAMLAPSLEPYKRGVGTDTTIGTAINGVKNVTNGDHKTAEHYPWSTEKEDSNPTVVPRAMLEKFHWIFLIRDPHRSIPSYYRCTIPPLDEVTGFYEFYPDEAGYVEVRLVFDYLRRIGAVGPQFTGGSTSGSSTHGNISNPADGTTAVDICVIDADDMLDYPAKYIEAVCNAVGYPYTPDMLEWDNEEDQRAAREAFEKWRGFHDDAIKSTSLHPREKKHHLEAPKAEEQWDREWNEKYGAKGAKIIRETVDATMDDYLYLKQFALKLY